MGRYIFVGDVHGCREELDALLDSLQLRYDDRLHFVGDLVNKGPDSLGVLRRVAALVECHPRSVCIAGNHEEKVLRLRETGRPTSPWTRDATDDDWSFLESLPLYHRIEELAVLLIHGGLYPAYFESWGPLGAPPPLWRLDQSRRSQGMRRFLRVRRLRRDGQPVPHRYARPSDPHWSDVYDGREGFVFFGHDPQFAPYDPLVAPHAIGLDTAACYGGKLTAAVLEPGQRPAEAQFFAVPSRTYAHWRGPVPNRSEWSAPGEADLEAVAKV